MTNPNFSDEKFKTLLKRNELFLAEGSFEKPRPLAEAAKLVEEHGYKALCILTCADGRVLPEEIFGLKKGDAIVLRNAGGRAIESDIFRSLGVMSTIAPIGTLVVLHHTDCGGLFTTDEAVGAELAKRAPDRAYEAQNYLYGTFKQSVIRCFGLLHSARMRVMSILADQYYSTNSIGLEQSIKDDVEEIKNWPFLEKDTNIMGFAYEIETGRLRKVC